MVKNISESTGLKIMSKTSESQTQSEGVITTRIANIYIRTDGIIQCDGFAGTEIILQDAVDCINAQAQLAEGKKRPILVTLNSVKSMDREARMYFGGEEAAKNANSTALVVSSPIGRVIGNFFIGLNKSRFPTKLFTSEDEAVAWLKKFIE